MTFLRAVWLSVIYYISAAMSAAAVLFNAQAVSDSERAISELDSAEQRTDSLIQRHRAVAQACALARGAAGAAEQVLARLPQAGRAGGQVVNDRCLRGCGVARLSGHFVGLFIGTFTAVRVVANVGHIRAFAALALIMSVAALCHVLIVDPLVWFVLRVAAKRVLRLFERRGLPMS